MSFFLIILFLALFLIIRAYFFLARKNNLVDIPNKRSSHQGSIIRGGGIIIPIGVIAYLLLNQIKYPYFVIGLCLISTISFLDDLGHLKPIVRITGQGISMVLLFYQLIGINMDPALIVLYIIALGALNAYNFMDGINGIMALYSLVFLLTAYYIQLQVVSFTDSGLILISTLGVGIFSFYNVRNKAVCFAGDVGSVSVGFIVIFFIGSLIITTGSIIWILLLSVYGVDSVLTIVHRLMKKENIFEAHRSHLYQYYANISGQPHLKISFLYAFVQLVINLLIIVNYQLRFINEILLAVIILLPLALVYIVSKRSFEQKILEITSEKALN